MDTEVVLKPAEMTRLGQELRKTWEQYKLDRKAHEDRCLQNLRQFRGVIDPVIAEKIPSDRSKAYPKLTRWKCIGTVARLMQMLFPGSSEKNWELKPTPMPNLSKEQLQVVLDTLVAKKVAEGIAPVDVECKDEEIEKAISDFAVARSDRMALKINDDLVEMDFVTLARRVIFSGVLYNTGTLEGPMHQTYPARTWSKNALTGKYEAQDSVKLKPLFDFCPVWEYYPDMTAKTLDKQDGKFRRRVMTRRDVEALAKRPDFITANIEEWLLKNKTGNWKAEHWETQLASERKGDQTSVDRSESKKYVVLAYWGDYSGHDLAACGAKIPEDELHKTFVGNVWMIDSTIIKAKVAVIDDPALNHHTFMFEEDDMSLMGNGQCDTLRDSALSVGEITRMLLDEMSVGGENMLVFPEMLVPGQDLNARSFKVWKQEGQGQALANPAVRPVPRHSRVIEFVTALKQFVEFANNESGLPPPSLGDVSGGGSEALRTQQNASMFLGAAALPIRDTVRNYDMFTTSVITSLMKWNLKYDPNPSRDGDYQAIGRGSTSLIAKEVLAQSLDAFRTTLTPDEQAHVDTRKLLVMRGTARDIPIDDILLSEEQAKQNLAAQQQQAQTQQAAAIKEIESKIRKNLADALKAVADAHATDATVQVDAIKMLMEVFSGGPEGQGAGSGATAGSTP